MIKTPDEYDMGEEDNAWCGLKDDTLGITSDEKVMNDAMQSLKNLGTLFDDEVKRHISNL